MPNRLQPSRLVVLSRSSMWKNGMGESEPVTGAPPGLYSSLVSKVRVSNHVGSGSSTYSSAATFSTSQTGSPLVAMTGLVFELKGKWKEEFGVASERISEEKARTGLYVLACQAGMYRLLPSLSPAIPNSRSEF